MIARCLSLVNIFKIHGNLTAITKCSFTGDVDRNLPKSLIEHLLAPIFACCCSCLMRPSFANYDSFIAGSLVSLYVLSLPYSYLAPIPVAFCILFALNRP